jgi:antitoxin (DNA-binding transcriptional repressor) of toxin-antitoxin stability system
MDMAVTRIGAAEFRARCLALLDELTPEGMVVTKRGRPVALVTPYPPRSRDLIGTLRKKIETHGDLLPTGIAWKADQAARPSKAARRRSARRA